MARKLVHDFRAIHTHTHKSPLLTSVAKIPFQWHFLKNSLSSKTFLASAEDMLKYTRRRGLGVCKMGRGRGWNGMANPQLFIPSVLLSKPNFRSFGVRWPQIEASQKNPKKSSLKDGPAFRFVSIYKRGADYPRFGQDPKWHWFSWKPALLASISRL